MLVSASTRTGRWRWTPAHPRCQCSCHLAGRLVAQNNSVQAAGTSMLRCVHFSLGLQTQQQLQRPSQQLASQSFLNSTFMKHASMSPPSLSTLPSPNLADADMLPQQLRPVCSICACIM